ncbi:MAG: bifunctional methylenetetrahydrofolate dehydrogenase/methenyltetrahydrofolate cyclohydrolase FolD [Clostridia bacterium]|nr:bifunctional methylenetetrahydrofolate dehydrogenase/methenyltetrahydrofolate cyclohydrolase FolD [Clostridia bacterium]
MTNRPKIIDGKALSQKIRSELKTKAAAFEASHNRKAGLAVILVGEDSASQIYVRNKITACEEVGIRSFAHYLPKETGKDDIIELIEALNSDNSVDGILVQLPLPDKSVENEILEHVSPFKDVDGFHAVNAGNLLLGNQCLAACTPSGVIELIKSAGTEISGKHAVVIGRSNIVGKPVAMLLLQENATVTVCHSKTRNLKDIAKDADILVVAIGKKEFVTADMVKVGAVVIDVGMNRHDGKLYGDVKFDEVSEKAAFITPVPGGVGPMTITMLLNNTIKAAERGSK